jgi:pimeloyl-ACP methyl ester carboxylesterase
MKSLLQFEHFTSVNDVPTHYYDTGGSGHPLVLLHGGGTAASAALAWAYNIPPLSKSFRVIAPDRLGYGMTGMSAMPDYSLTGSAEHVAALLKQLRVKHAFILGWSQGAWLAGYLAIKHPVVVKKLILLANGVIPVAYDYRFSKGLDQRKPKSSYTKEEVDRWFASYFLRLDLITEEMKSLALDYGKKNLDVSNRRDEATGASAMSHLLDGCIDGRHISELLHLVVAPTLIVWGAQDPLPVERGVWMMNAIKGSEFHVFDGAKHGVFLDQWESFNSLVELFLKRV